MASYRPFQTRYMRMVVEADEIPWEYNVLACTAHWILLAGYLVVPGTFTSMKDSNTINDELENNKAGKVLLDTIQNPPLLATACIFFSVGCVIMSGLYWRYKDNYIWLVNKLFIPTFLNALAGLLTTIINIYTAHNGDWSIMALLATITSGISLLSSFTLVLVYKFQKLEEIKQAHREEIGRGN